MNFHEFHLSHLHLVQVQVSFRFHLLFAHSLFDLRHDGHKDRDKLVGFFYERFQFFGRNNLRFHKQVQPIIGFNQLLENAFELIDNVGIRFGSMAFSVLCSNRRARPHHLLTQHLSLR